MNPDALAGCATAGSTCTLTRGTLAISASRIICAAMISGLPTCLYSAIWSTTNHVIRVVVACQDALLTFHPAGQPGGYLVIGHGRIGEQQGTSVIAGLEQARKHGRPPDRQTRCLVLVFLPVAEAGGAQSRISSYR